ncbi:NAD-P-binding protein [Polyporus arcularius HHB13444]|uniref:NAD-P-binding protein n=1 Tax=Polyporus arcularius HHB13444 TaxID=1314778 RepID=A0A5C3NP91_9APHY|nr:NAD-P-binding protein [Polyporus arcularius HHB13444]
MPSEKLQIFYTGATGYIGGAVLQLILQHPTASTFAITALVRDAAKAQLLESKFGVKSVVGSLQDFDKLTELAENAYIVVHTADATDEAALKAILAGLKRRHEKTGDVPHLIHTSGAGVVADDARGAYLASHIYSDLDVAALDALPPTAPAHAADLLLVKADEDGYARTYIIKPGYVYGTPSGPLYDAGIAKKTTIMLPWLADVFARRGRAGVLGGGKNVWACVHVHDNAGLYYRLFSKILEDPSRLGHGREGYYFSENGECTLYDMCKAVGEALVAVGVATEAEPNILSPEECDKYFGKYGALEAVRMFFANVRCRADRARRDLGWAPTHTPDEVLKTAREIVDAVVEKQGLKTKA